MKTKTSLLIFAVILLVSCTPVAIIEPTSTIVFIPTETKVLTPTDTSTPEPTATVTPEIIPDYMLEFIEKGYDTLPADVNTQYMVELEGTSKFSSEQGIKFGDIRIFSWMTVAYFDENHVLQQDIILDGVCKIDGPNKGRHTLVDSTSVNWANACPSLAFFKNTRKGVEEHNAGHYIIWQAFFGTGSNEGKDMIFEGVFPNGNNQIIQINGIGDVLNVEYLKYVNP